MPVWLCDGILRGDHDGLSFVVCLDLLQSDNQGKYESGIDDVWQTLLAIVVIAPQLFNCEHFIKGDRQYDKRNQVPS